MRIPVTPWVRNALLGAAAVVAFAAGCASGPPPGPPPSYQPHMQNALAALQVAQSELQQAEPNKGGHRERALELVSHAIFEVQRGIDFAAQRGY
jgi:hypothetical protein